MIEHRYADVNGVRLHYATVPFLLLFVWGYLYTGVMSLGQVYLERLRFGLRAPVEARPAPSGAPGF